MTRALDSLRQSTTAGAEREVKFVANRAIIGAAQTLPLLGGGDERQAQRLETVYYDTEDGDLARAGVALRMRRRNGASTIGLKRAVDADRGFFERCELEAPSPSGKPDLALFGDAGRAIAKIIGEKELAPKFGSDVRRSARTVEVDGAAIEVALDSGFLFAGERREPIHEIELELKSGEEAALFSFALAVLDALPVRLCVESKAERAARLLSSERPAPVKAHPPRLTPETALDEAIGVLLRNCLGQFLGNLPALEQGDAVEAVHQMRVAMRRQRSALGLFHRAFPCEGFASLRHESKRIGAALGEARDWDVFVGTLHDGPLPHFADEPGFDGLMREARAKADDRRAAALRVAGDGATTRFALVLERFVAERGWRNATNGDRIRQLDEPVVSFAAKSLERLDRKLRKRGRHFRSLPPEARHALRIAMKHMRYATEFFGHLFHPAAAAERYARRAAALQDLLGELNDAAIASGLIRQFDRSSGPDFAYALGAAAGWCGRASLGDKRTLERAWRSFIKSERYWRREGAGQESESD